MLVMLKRYSRRLVEELFQRYEIITFEADDCDEIEMELRSMFINQREESFDTYIRERQEKTIQFIAVTEKDIMTILNLRKQIWATTYRGIYPDSMIDDFDYAWHMDKEMKRICNPEYAVYFITKDMLNIGYLTMRKTDKVILQSLYILEEYQHQGIGKLAFKFINKYCKENGANSFICHCVPENKNARLFYEKMGGEIIGEDLDNEESWMNSVIYQFKI